MDRVAVAVLDERELVVEGRYGQADEVVVGMPHHLPLLLEDADDEVLRSIELEPLVDRVFAGEERLPHVLSDYGDRRGVLDVRLGQEPPVPDEVVVRERIVGGGAQDDRRRGLRVAVLDVDVRIPEVALGRHGAHLRDLGLQGDGVFPRQVLAVPLARVAASGAEARLELLELDERGAEALEVAHHVVVEAVDDRDHGDYRRDADDDPEDGQEGPQLVRPHREKREPDVLAETPPQVPEEGRHF